MSPSVSPAADTDISPSGFRNDPREREVDLALARVRRNPIIHTFDKTGLPAARKFKAHKVVADSIAADLRSGDMFAFVQPSGRGFWASEWSVVDAPGARVAVRRRAGHAGSVTTAVEDMLTHPSFHSSHYFRPDEGLLGWYRRK